MSNIKTYVPSSIVIAINHARTGVSHVVTSLMKDSIVSIEFPDSTWTESADNYGSLERVHSKDNNIRMTLHVPQTSPDNDVFEALATYDEKDPTGLDGIFTCSFADKSSRAWAYSAECFLKRPQNYEYNNGVSPRDWMIVFSNADKYMGGSGKLNQDIVDNLAKLGVDIEDRWKANA